MVGPFAKLEGVGGGFELVRDQIADAVWLVVGEQPRVGGMLPVDGCLLAEDAGGPAQRSLFGGGHHGFLTESRLRCHSKTCRRPSRRARAERRASQFSTWITAVT